MLGGWGESYFRDGYGLYGDSGFRLVKTCQRAYEPKHVTVRIGNAVHRALDRVGRSGGRFWLHLDLDVLDDAVLPGVDDRLPGGLSVGEVQAVLCRASKTASLAGLTVTVLNPDLDPDGRQADLAVQVVAAAVASG